MACVPVFSACLLLILTGAPVASACEDAACFSEEESRWGGQCTPEDGLSSEYARYYNASADAGDVRVESFTLLKCEDYQPGPSRASVEMDYVRSSFLVHSPGREDRVDVNLTYGTRWTSCYLFVFVDFDPVLLFDTGDRVGFYLPCDLMGPVPSVAESLP